MQLQETLIKIAGLLHFGILVASALVPQVLDWRRELNVLSELSRHLVWVHGIFIVLVIMSFGAIALINAEELAGGTMLARSVCGFIAMFWLSRLGVQLFWFNAKPYLQNAGLKVGYHALTGVFTYIGVVFTWCALAPAATGT